MTDFEARALAESLGWKASFCHMSGDFEFSREGVTPVRLRVENLSSDRLARMLKIALCRSVTPAESVSESPIKGTSTMTSLYASLLKFQSANVPIHKNCVANLGGGRQYRYADLPSVLASIKPALSDCGLVLIQLVDGGTLTTRIMHAGTGEALESHFPLPLDGLNWHGIGSAVSYARRYALTSLLGLAPDDDDDAVSTLPAKTPTVAQRGNGGPVTALKRDIPSSCPHCAEPMSVGPRGSEYCKPCWQAKRNGYAAYAKPAAHDYHS